MSKRISGSEHPTHANEGIQRLVHGSLWNGISTTANRVLPVLLTIVLARLLTPTELGAVSFVLASYTVLSTIADWGIAYALQKFIPENPQQGNRIAWTALALRVGISLVLGTICWLMDLSLAVFRGYGTYVAVLLVSSALGTVVFVFNAQFRFRQASLTSMLWGVSWFALSIALVAVGLRVAGPLYALALSYLIIGGLVFLVDAEFRSHIGFDRGVARQLVRFGALATAVSGLNAFTSQAGILALTYLIGERTAGVYKIAVTFGMAPILLAGVVTLPFLPIARKSLLSSPGRTAEMIRLVVRYLLMIGLPLFGAGVVLAQTLINMLVGDAYVSAVWPLRFLLAANVLGMLFGVLSAIPFMGDGLRDLAKINLQVAAVVLVGNIIFIPMWGSNGAALALLLANAVGLVLLFVWFQHKLPIQLEWRRYAIYAVSTGEMVLVLLLVSVLAHAPGMQLGLGMMLAAITYGLALVVQKGITIGEILRLMGIERKNLWPEEISWL